MAGGMTQMPTRKSATPKDRMKQLVTVRSLGVVTTERMIRRLPTYERISNLNKYFKEPVKAYMLTKRIISKICKRLPFPRKLERNNYFPVIDQ